MRVPWLAVLGLAACEPTVTVTVVTIEVRPAVHDVDTIEITFGNDNATLEQSFTVTGREFPLTFSVETPGRTGALTITARALDADAHLAALGEATAEILPDQTAAATLLLDPADFPVNTSVAGQQRLSWNRSSAGAQLAAGLDGTFTIGFSDDCGALGRCDLWGRRFDVTATPVSTLIAASDVQFNINRTEVFGNDPALAVSANGTMLAAWSTFDEILAVAITSDGDAVAATETTVSTGTSPSDPQVAALPGGSFLITWTETDTLSGDDLVRARMMTAAGTPAVSPETGNDLPFTINTDTLGTPTSASVAASGDGLQVGFAWQLGNAIHVRFTNTGGLLVPATELEIANYPVADDVWGPQIIASPDGRFLVAWGHRTFGGGAFDDGAIVVRKIAAPIATQVGFESIAGRGLADSFEDRFTRVAIAADPDGAVLVSWQGCGAGGDDNGCGVIGQLMRDSGLPVGPPFVINTTTESDQLSPSLASLGGGAFAATWTDDSRAAPDTSETGIRARILYPAFTTAAGVIGAPCGGADEATCGAGLSCLAGSDGEPHCHASCAPQGPAPQCPAGGSCTTAGSVSGCIF